VLEKVRGAYDFMHGKAHDLEGIKVIDDYTLETDESDITTFKLTKQ